MFPPFPPRRKQHVKMVHFNIVLALCGLAVMWRIAATPSIGGAAGMSVSNAPGDAFAIIGTIAYCIFSLL